MTNSVEECMPRLHTYGAYPAVLATGRLIAIWWHDRTVCYNIWNHNWCWILLYYIFPPLRFPALFHDSQKCLKCPAHPFIPAQFKRLANAQLLREKQRELEMDIGKNNWNKSPWSSLAYLPISCHGFLSQARTRAPQSPLMQTSLLCTLLPDYRLLVCSCFWIPKHPGVFPEQRKSTY